VIPSSFRFPLFRWKEFHKLNEALEMLENVEIVVDSACKGKEETNKYLLSNLAGRNSGCSSKKQAEL
jgi:hypothetical protein